MPHEPNSHVLFSIQVLSNLLSFVGSVIVLVQFFSNPVKKKLHQTTMIHLIMTSGILSVTNLYYHFWRLYIRGYFSTMIERDGIREFLTRVMYIVRVFNQFFVISSMMWTICISVALCYTLTLYQYRPIREWKIFTFFYFLAVFLPLCDMIFWGTYFQCNITSDGDIGAIPYNLGVVFETTCYCSHAAYLALGFLINLTLLIVIWRVIKKQSNAIRGQDAVSEIQVVYNLSWYVVPSLISCIWQVIGYLLLGAWTVAHYEGVLLLIFNLVQYPYSFFFPLQGFLNAFVFYFNRRRLIKCCKKCCKRRKSEKVQDVSVDETEPLKE
jgi:hypothetical protein